MKRFAAAFLTLLLVFSLVACGGEEKAPDPSPKNTSQPTNTPDDGKTEEPEVTLSAKGMTCTVTVPELETFIDGYEIVTAGCNDSTAVQTVYAKLYREDPMIEINVSVEQLTISGAESQDAKGYAEYYNSRDFGPYEPIEIAGYSGYLKAVFSDSSKVADNWYIIDYPLSDGTSMVVSLYVGQKYADDTSAMAPIAEAFLKNIEVAPNA